MSTNTAIQSAYAPPAMFGTTATSNASDSTVGLDADTIFEMVKEKYEALTGTFTKDMTDEKLRQGALQHAQQAKNAIAQFVGRDIDESQDPNQFAACKQAASDAIAYLESAGVTPGDPAITQLTSLSQKSGKITSYDVGDANTQIDTVISNNTADSQLNMLQLQDTMSKMQTLMSMGTNIEATIHDMQKGIVANMHA